MEAEDNHQPGQIIVQKEREEQRDQIIMQQLREARSLFFKYSIVEKLKGAGATDKEQQSALQLFLKPQYTKASELQIHEDFKDLKAYEKQIGQLQQAYKKMEQHFNQRKKECPPIVQIIQRKYSTLKVVKIQYTHYKQQTLHCPLYSVSASDLFKMIQNNPLLRELSLKGVQVQKFQQFIRVINPSNQTSIVQKYREQFSWAKHLSFPKLLKLTIDAKIKFKVDQSQDTAQKLRGLTFLCEKVDLSGLKVMIGFKRQFNVWRIVLEKIWRVLRQMKQIKLILFGNRLQICAQLAQIVRSEVFRVLTSFTQITQLDFIDFDFRLQSQNGYLAIEQSLDTIFDNNQITHLRLDRCYGFPTINKTNTLQSIDLASSSFRNKIEFMQKLTQNHNSIKSIAYSQIYQQLSISESLFNKLQNLRIFHSKQVSLQRFIQNQPSNIKSLQVGNSDGIRLYFIIPKLLYLTSLSLWHIKFDYYSLSKIPSKELQKLEIGYNSVLTNQDIRKIDLKWPYLRRIRLHICKNVSEDVWSTCAFMGLATLTLDWSMLGRDLFGRNKSLEELKLRGIKVMIIQ